MEKTLVMTEIKDRTFQPGAGHPPPRVARPKKSCREMQWQVRFVCLGLYQKGLNNQQMDF